jgi:hypothetical protein
MSRQELIILSAEKSDNRPERNKQLTENLRGCLDDLNLDYDNATGLFNGIEEASFVVRPKNDDEIELIRSYAFKSFKQDSILQVDKNNEAFLMHSNGLGKTYQGVFTELNSNEPLDLTNNYTLVNGVYYTTKFRKF